MEFFMMSEKTPQFQGSPAHQGPIDIRLAHQFSGIGRLDAAAILNADAFGHRLVKQLRQAAADEGMDVLRLLGRRVAARADGPDRFIGQDRFFHLFFAQPGQTALQLSGDDTFGLAGFAFGERFAYTNDWL